MRGAGGTAGGIGTFFIGLIMFCVGIYLLLNAITVTTHFGMGMQLYRFNAMGGHYSLTSGGIMIPFIIGVGMIFYNRKNWIGWILASSALLGLIAGVIMSIQFSFRSMSAFDLIVIIVLAVGGLGLLLRSLK